METRGYGDIMLLHDDVGPIIERKEDIVRQCRADMLEIFGPGNNLGYGWAVCIDPSEITVSESLHEEHTDWNNLNLAELP